MDSLDNKTKKDLDLRAEDIFHKNNKERQFSSRKTNAARSRRGWSGEKHL